MIVALNTSEPRHELALLLENPSNKGEWELLEEKSWIDERLDVDTLVPILKELLERTGMDKSDISDIVVVKGPGSYSSVRTGVAFANALADGLGCRLYGLNTFELLRRKLAVTGPTLALLHAGRLEAGAAFDEEPVRIGSLADLLKDHPHGNLHVAAVLPDGLNKELNSIVLEKNWTRVEGHQLQTLGETMMTYGLTGLEEVTTVEPYYLRGPHITISADPWKK